MKWSEALEKRWQEVEQGIKDRQPVVDEWSALREEQELLRRIRSLQNGQARTPEAQGTARTWKQLCDEHGWRVGGDSAHRVVNRMDPALHASFPHECSYDGRSYP